jgi:hypothetical protein
VNAVASAVQNAASTAVTWVTNGVQSIVSVVGNSGGTSGTTPQKVGKGDTVLGTTLDIDVVTLSVLNRHLCSAEALRADAKKINMSKKKIIRRAPLLVGSSNYNRQGAVAYALRYANGQNHNYLKFDDVGDNIIYFLARGTRLGSDCANFVSQALYEGGKLSMNDSWYYNMEIEVSASQDTTLPLFPIINITGEFSSIWSFANSQYLYFSNTSNGYSKGSLTINAATGKQDIKDAIKKGVKAGDLLYWDFDSNGNYSHATIITSVSQESIGYSGHSSARSDADLLSALDTIPNATLKIVQMRS